MFTGIETLGTIKEIPMKEKNNLHVTVESSITGELQIDQSVAHNGICLTVVAIKRQLLHRYCYR
jgi:riboflavin synthase